jgi:hypothetical protein
MNSSYRRRQRLTKWLSATRFLPKGVLKGSTEPLPVTVRTLVYAVRGYIKLEHGTRGGAKPGA